MAKDIKILIVDDSITMRQTLEWILVKDYQVATAQDGVEAIEQYALFSPDIILLDINMPRLDGFGVVEHIRQEARDQDVFILMLTAEEHKSFKPRALNLGANDFLYKPFDRTELLARLGVAERQTRLTRQLRGFVEQKTRELELVANLQEKLLPQESPYFPGVQIHNVYLPSGQASGDYFDYFTVRVGTLRLIIADVSGHGARAAFLMAIVRTLFRFTKNHYMGLEETFSLINRHLYQIIGRESDFVTAFAADIHIDEGRMEYINCGHCPGMLKQPDDNVRLLHSQLPMLGFFELDFKSESVDFKDNAEMFLFTDGFFEWGLESDKLIELDDFLVFAEKILKSDGSFLDNLLQRLEELSSQKPVFRDDLTALWVKKEAPA